MKSHLKCSLGGLLLLLAGPFAVSADEQSARDLLALQELSRLGAPELALARLEAKQPGFGEQPYIWEHWERARLMMLQRLGRWEAIEQRLGNLPHTASAPFRNWAEGVHFQAVLNQGQAGRALDFARQRLWRAQPGAMQAWRERVMRAYMAGGRYEDAYVAMLRYQQDYRPSSDQWAALRAEILTGAGRAQQALALLDTEKADPLQRLQTRLAAGRMAPREVLAQLDSGPVDEAPERRQQRLVLMVDAARQAGDQEAHIRTLEQLLALQSRHPWLPRKAEGATQLWQAYVAYGRRLGNERQLLIGDDTRWYAEALERLEDAPQQGRALLAALAEVTTRAAAHEQAHLTLAQSLLTTEAGRRLQAVLYADPSRFPRVEDIPAGVRYLLVDRALEHADIRRASALMHTLPEPPADESGAFDWQLRRARILVLAGEVEAGSDVLDNLLDGLETIEPEQVDRLLQVSFDLQKQGAHARALGQFRRLLEKPLPPKQRRELLFWAGESHAGLGQHAAAAEFFIRSANLLEPYALDPWAQTALYHASQSLARAGLKEDARAMLQRLLKVTRDPARRAVLQRDLQQLWLAPKTGSHG